MDPHPVSTVLREIGQIFHNRYISCKIYKLQGFIRGEWNWPLFYLNDLETQERDFRGSIPQMPFIRSFIVPSVLVWSVFILDQPLILKAIYTIDSMVYIAYNYSLKIFCHFWLWIVSNPLTNCHVEDVSNIPYIRNYLFKVFHCCWLVQIPRLITLYNQPVLTKFERCH